MRSLLVSLLILPASCTRPSPHPSHAGRDVPPIPHATTTIGARSGAPSVDDRVAPPPTVPMPGAWQRFVAVSERELVDVADGRVVTIPAEDGRVVVVGSDAVLADHDGMLVARSLPSMDVRWRAHPEGRCTAFAANDAWIFCSGDGRVTALRGSDGRTISWSLPAREPVQRLAATTLRGVVLQHDGTVVFVDPDHGLVRSTLPPPVEPLDRMTSWEPLVVARDGSAFCRVDRGATFFSTSCHAADGTQHYSSGPFVHTRITESVEGREHVRRSEPFRYLRRVTRSHLLWESSAPAAWGATAEVTGFRSGHVQAMVIPSLAGVVEGDGDALAGVFAVRDRRVIYEAPGYGGERWSYADDAGTTDVETVLVGARVAVAGFHRFATGSSLAARAIADGAVAWRADVAQLAVPHSEYENDVRLFAREGALILVGREAGGSCVQGFDAETGARRFAVLRRTWAAR